MQLVRGARIRAAGPIAACRARAVFLEREDDLLDANGLRLLSGQREGMA